MGKCKDCKSWEESKEYGSLSMGKCHKKRKLMEEIVLVLFNGANRYLDAIGINIETKASFGCIHFEKKN